MTRCSTARLATPSPRARARDARARAVRDDAPARWRCPACLRRGARARLRSERDANCIDGGDEKRAAATYRCANGHALDASASGYVNLFVGKRVRGDSRAQLRARRRFLVEGGHFGALSEAVADAVLGRAADARDGDAELGLAVELRSGGDAASTTATSPRARRMARKREARSEARAANPNAANPNAASAKVKAKPLRVVDFGCGEGYYSSVVLERARARDDVELELAALDASKDAADLCAAAIGRFARVAVADATRDLPLDDDSVDVAMSVFAPRSPTELARVLRKGGRAVVASPDDDHMVELRDAFRDDDKITVLGVEPNKSTRVDEAFLAAGFDVVFRRAIRDVVPLPADAVADLVFMGPSGFHNPESAIRDAVGDAPRVVTTSFNVVVYALLR